MGEYFFSDLHDLKAFEGYVDFLLSRIRDSADKVLAERFRRARGVTAFRRRGGRGIADIHAYILPSGVKVVSEARIPIQVSIVANPSVGLQGEHAVLYLRLASIGSEFGRTFIAAARVPLRDLRGEVSVEAEPILCGIMPYECVEDPRVDPVRSGELYHVRAMYVSPKSCVVTFRTPFRGRKPGGIEAVHFVDSGGDTFLLRDFRDTFPP